LGDRLTDFYVFVSREPMSSSDRPDTPRGRADVCAYHFPRRAYGSRETPLTTFLAD
jgi:hypothetical protein